MQGEDFMTVKVLKPKSREFTHKQRIEGFMPRVMDLVGLAGGPRRYLEELLEWI